VKLEKEKIEKIVLGAIVGIIVIVVLVFLVFGPSIRKIGELNSEIIELRSKVRKAENAIASLDRKKNEVKSLNEEIKKYDNELPESASYWLLGKLNEVSEITGITFDKIEPKGYSMQLGEYKLQEVDLFIKAGYHKLGEIINRLENSSSFISVWNLHIAQNDQDIKNHNIILTVGAFVQDNKEEEKK